MNDTTNERILGQVFDIVRLSSPLSNYEAMTFSLQLLAWAKLSSKGQLKGALQIQEKTYADPNWLMKVWDELSRRPDTALAFSGWKSPSRLTPSALGSAIELCVRLAETGVLDNFDPTDCYFKDMGREAGEYSLPPELAELMTDLAGVSAKTSVYTPWDNSIQLASRAAKRGASAYIETMREPTLHALISLFVEGHIEIGHGDPIREPSAVEGGKLRQFDTTLAFPPIGVRYTPDVLERDWYGRFRDRTNSGTVLAVWHVMAQTGGRIVIAVPSTILSSPGADRVLREELLKRGLIEAVIAMPSGLLLHANLSFSLLVLNMRGQQDSIRFVNAEDARFREPISKARAKLVDIEGIVARATGELVDELVVEVPTESVFANDTMLQINRYVLPDSSRNIERIMASAKTCQLGEIASIYRPFPPCNSEDAMKVLEVGATDLPVFGYIAAPSKNSGIDPATAQRNMRQFLKPLDIVIIIKGSVGKVGIVPEEIPAPGEGGWVVGQSAVILRVNDPEIIDPKVLALYLRSPLGKELLDGLAVKGATIPLIQQRELQRLPVIIPTKQEAAEISKSLDKQAELQREIEQLRSRQDALAKQYWALD